MRDELNKAMAETEAAYQRLRELIDKQRTVFNQYCCLKYEVEIGGEVYSKNGGIAILDAFLMRDEENGENKYIGLTNEPSNVKAVLFG
ncbi:MAG: hypothetical protein PHI12_13305 [Dehalococcoidales bacterium]|nr:hypothetical protein [Dehalococcoidales bacterium]